MKTKLQNDPQLYYNGQYVFRFVYELWVHHEYSKTSDTTYVWSALKKLGVDELFVRECFMASCITTMLVMGIDKSHPKFYAFAVTIIKRQFIDEDKEQAIPVYAYQYLK